MSILKKFPSVNLNYVYRVLEPNNHCHLTYSDISTKSEILSGGVPPLVFDDLAGIIDSDWVLLNFISGRDINMKSLKKFCSQCEGKIYIDIHSYTLGRKKDGRRFLRMPRAWINIVQTGDFIQMNREELALLAGSRGKECTVEENVSDLYKNLTDKDVNCEAKHFLITDGAAGSYLVQIDGGKINLKRFPQKDSAVSGDTTGCGDCFGAGFVAASALGQNPIEAIISANSAANNRARGLYSIPAA
jgi:hypothetical protein